MRDVENTLTRSEGIKSAATVREEGLEAMTPTRWLILGLQVEETQ
jgi:hypothetical protein